MIVLEIQLAYKYYLREAQMLGFFLVLFAMDFIVWRTFITLFCQMLLPACTRHGQCSRYLLNEKDEDLQSQEGLQGTGTGDIFV